MKINWNLVQIAGGLIILFFIYPKWGRKLLKEKNELYLSASLKSCASNDTKCINQVKKFHEICFKKWLRKGGSARGIIIMRDEYFNCMTKKTGIKEWEKPKTI